MKMAAKQSMHNKTVARLADSLPHAAVSSGISGRLNGSLRDTAIVQSTKVARQMREAEFQWGPHGHISNSHGP